VVAALLLTAFVLGAAAQSDAIATQAFTLRERAEVVATITAACGRCDWREPGREAAVLELWLDGEYSQHVVLTRGAQPSPYRVMLGPLGAGAHELSVRRDAARSAADAGTAIVEGIAFESFGEDRPEHLWLSRAPFLYSRPGTLEQFTDLPLLMYAETGVPGEAGGTYRVQYTAIFSHEDGGTPADRLMATWGRTTDIEFVFGVTEADASGPSRELIQGEGHRWIPFDGPRLGDHPLLWVATVNNMVASTGPAGLARFAPAPELAVLAERSREAVMDAHPWTYAVTSAEVAREGRVAAGAPAGSERIPEPRQYATVEACADVSNATLAFDVGVRGADGSIAWHATDRDQPAFRIARGGCFRGGAPLPAGTSPQEIAGLRVRAYPRPARQGEPASVSDSARVVLRRVNQVFMLDASHSPAPSPIRWTGEMAVPTDGRPVEVPPAR
jgi:hypothetical protein